MKRISILHLAILLIASSLIPCALQAQEPAFYQGGQSARFIDGPDTYHYVQPCSPKTTAGPNMIPPDAPHGLCWQVRAARVTMVDGKLQIPPLIRGVMYVSATELRFAPSEAKDAASAFSWPTAAASYKYDTRREFAFLLNKDVGYAFAFLNVCSLCVSGTTPPPLDKAQLDLELQLFGDSLKQIDPVWKRISAVASRIRVEVLPTNQPTAKDPPAAMKLYGTMNEKLAPQCPEPAAACIQSYAHYQLCEAGPSPNSCGSPPSCSATCGVEASTYKGIKANVCYSARNDSASLIPDWTEVFLQQDASRAAHTPQDLKLVPADPSHPPQFPGTNPKTACGVTDSYEIAQIAHMGDMAHAAAPMPSPAVDAKGIARVSASFAFNLRQTYVTPVYPPIAKAARVSGTVLLHATIGKDGTVSALTVVTGPPMLQSAALDAVHQWTYKPYLVEGKPVIVETTINVIFSLGDGPKPPSPTPN